MAQIISTMLPPELRKLAAVIAKWPRVVKIAALALLVIIVVAIGGYVYSAKQHTPAPSTFSYACAGDAESYLCLAKAYQQETKQQGPTAAFATLKTAYQTDPSVRTNCHQLAHVIGRTVADSSKSIGEAYAQGDNFCWSGYYHGVIESMIIKIGAKNLDNVLPTVCAQVAAAKKYSFYHFNCVHGLGHGIMDVHQGDLFASLKICDTLHDSWEQQSCYGGVFMQNEMNELDNDHGKPNLKADDPMYPCTAVNDAYKQQCYLMQTSHALRVAGENFATVFAECSAVEAQYADTCYQSLGRDASGNSNSTVASTKASCMLGQTLDAQANCIIGAVKDFISYYHSDQQAETLCAALDKSLQPTCETTKTQYYNTF